MAWFSSNKNTTPVNWKNLTSLADLNNAIEDSKNKTVVIFKHSTRCSISAMAKSKFERNWEYTDEEITPFYLDLIAHRDVSNEIANKLGIQHQSPQMIVLKEGVPVLNLSHNAINAPVLKEYI